MAMTRDNIEMIHGYMEALTDLHMEELEKIISQPSESAKKEEAASCAAAWMELFANMGMKTQLLETSTNPAVFAEIRSKSEETLTILFYGHYDVSSMESEELWNTPPFRPTVLGGKMYGCGVSDSKGLFMAHAMAVQACLEVLGDVPVHVKFLLNGESACGNKSTKELFAQYRDCLNADLCYISDGCMYSETVPQIGCTGFAEEFLPIIKKVHKALEKIYGEKPVEMPLSEEDTAKVIADVAEIPAVCVPYANLDAGCHEANENLNLDCYFNGIHATAQVLYELGTAESE